MSEGNVLNRCVESEVARMVGHAERFISGHLFSEQRHALFPTGRKLQIASQVQPALPFFSS